MGSEVKHYRHIGAAGNFTLTGSGKLWAVNVTTGLTNSVITLYDGTSTAGPVIATIAAASVNNIDFKGLKFTNLHVVMASANSSATVVYS